MQQKLYPLGWVIACAACLPANGALMDVTYNNTSWTAAGVPIAIAVDFAPTTTQVQNLRHDRISGQTFTTVDGFTLDKIWIEYRNSLPVTGNYTLDLRLYEIPDANASNLPTTLTNLFSEPQLHVIPSSVISSADNNFAVFDVENIELDPATAYGFFFYLSGTTGTRMQWAVFSNANTYTGGSFYRLEQSPDNVGVDGIFALQYLPPAPPPPDDDPPPTVISMPEPAGLTLLGLSLSTLAARRRRSAR